MSSILGLVPAPMRGAYVASKYALEGLMTVHRGWSLRGSGVHVSLIEPGPVPSKIAQNALAYVRKYIDVDNSVHTPAYSETHRRTGGGRHARTTAGARPGGSARRLRHALNAANPRPHYRRDATGAASAVLRQNGCLPAELFLSTCQRLST